MVKETFLRLPETKKKRITQALLTEFSNHALTDSQVARIVKDADIARGAFYKYFDDLTDAYMYLFRQAIQEIHFNMSPGDKFDPDFFYERVIRFIDESQHSKYEPMMKLHMLQNEAALPGSIKANSEQLIKMSPKMWAAMVLSHEVIMSVFADPDNREKNLKRYKEALYLIDRDKEVMYLAFKEIKREKLRYGLIILMIFLISYLIFMLSSLALGLADENTQAINSWKTQKVVMNKNANVSMTQSILTASDLKGAKLGKKEAYLGQTPVVVKAKNRSSLSAQFLGIKKNQFIYQDQDLASGRKAKTASEVTADIGFKVKGYKLGDKIKLNDSSKKYKIVGFVDNAKINIAPIVYGNLATWKSLRQGMNNVKVSGIISQNPNYKFNHKNAKTYDIKTVINKLPGYTAQNMTFELMIGFLFVISLIIIAVFLYILTMQKMHNFAVMRAQGIPSKTLVGATISQSIILVVSGVIIALIMMWITSALLPASVPMSFTPEIMIAGTLGMLLMGVIGSLIPVRSILKVDPAQAIGE